MKCAARGLLKIQDAKSRHFGTIAQLCLAVSSANFNGFRVLAALLHGTLVVGVNQTLRR